MPGNTFGTAFCVTTFGESHGPAIGCVIDGCPPGFELKVSDVQQELDKRRPGNNEFVSLRQEPDQVEILSGIFEGKTTGTPITLLIRNKDARSNDYSDLAKSLRPGHGDYTYLKKYGIRDHRGGGRASARETAARVAAGAIARKYLRENYQTNIKAYISQIGEIIAELPQNTPEVCAPFFFADNSKETDIIEYLRHLRKIGDSVGAKIICDVATVPVGLGDPVFAKLDASLAYALMGINAVKGVEIGSGFASCGMLGSNMRDPITKDGFLSNNSGGILAGISTGQDLRLGVAFKPTSSIAKSISTIDIEGNAQTLSVTGRHDPCVALRAIPIVEAMVALVLLDHLILHRGQNGNVL